MEAPESFSRARRRLPGLVVFAVAALLPPVIDGVSGNAPGAGVPAPDLAEFVDGRYARAIEARLESESWASRTLPPWDRELRLSLFGATVPEVVLGAGDRLYFAETCRRVGGVEAETRVDEHARLIGSAARWWRARGTTLVVAPAPDKESVEAARLPARLRPTPQIGRLLAALAREGVVAADLRPALDPAAGEGFHAGDTHWTPDGARRAAAETARVAVAACGGAAPGRPVATIVREGAPYELRGDLHRMLGLRPGSRVDARFRSVTRAAEGRRADGAPLVVDGPSAVVVCGTSFTRSCGWASLVAAELRREVSDLSVAGRGPTLGLLGLVARVRAGEEAAPTLIVWEFPEKHLFSRPAEFLEPLREFAASIAPEADFDAARAFRPAARRTVEDVAVASDAEGLLRGRGVARNGGRPDPRVVYVLSKPIPADGGAALVLEARSERPTLLKAYLDYGAGFSEAGARSVRLPGDGRSGRLIVPLRGPDAGSALVRFRVDPTNDDGAFELPEPALWPRRL